MDIHFKMYLTKKICILVTVGFTISLLCISALENGLARTPPMGWLAWERFRCNIDCINDPQNCISERLFMQMADLLVSEGYAAAGYEFINVDDCWLASTRDASGRLQSDPMRFPSGMKALGSYIHSKGLKFGIYEDFGTETCEGYPGIVGHLEQDAQTFAEWGVDYVKLDGCNSESKDMDAGYQAFGHFLNKTGRPMVYSCSWPVYQIIDGMTPDFTALKNTCNLWRIYNDIQDSWKSVESIIDYFGKSQDWMAPLGGPGHWNDPDMLIGGNFGLSYDQSKSQFALWAVIAAPLLMSVDLRTLKPEFKEILQNRKIIGVNQDPLGIQGRRVYKHRRVEIWARPITPVINGHYSYAVLFLNRRDDGTPKKLDLVNMAQVIGLDYERGYFVEDLYAGMPQGIYRPGENITASVNPSGCVIYKFTIVDAMQNGPFGPPPPPVVIPYYMNPVPSGWSN